LKREVRLEHILGMGAVLETGVGLVLLIDPSAASSLLLRAPLIGPGVVIARLAGGGLLGLGIACWYARGTPWTSAGLGVSRAFLTYNVVACAILVLARPPLPGGLAALAASAVHGLLAIPLLKALLGRGRDRSEPGGAGL
jgi:hypothetical protein